MRMDQLLTKLLEHGDHFIEAYQGRQRFRRSFTELHADVVRAVDALTRAGVERRMRVGLLGANSYEWVVYDLALIEIGALVVALSDEAVDEEGVEAARARYGLSLLLVDSDTPAEQPWIGRMDGLGPLDCAVIQDAPRQGEHDEELSWVFSSGSTGRLKCMKVSRRGTEYMIGQLPKITGEILNDDLTLLFLPFSHYQQRVAIYGAILHPYNVAVTVPKLLFTALQETRPTGLLAPPLFYEMVHRRLESAPGVKGAAARGMLELIDTLPEGSARAALQWVCSKPIRDALGGRVRHMLTGMAPIQASTLRLFTTLGMPLYEGYGITEAGLIAVNRVGARREGSVGRPLDPERVRLADDGEVLVHGEMALASGYVFLDPDEERKTFLDSGWIATGDVGRFDADGYLYLVGRKKVMILTPGGDKLHPEILERRLNECEGVLRSMVCSGGGAQLVAVLSLKQDAPATRAAVDRCVTELNRGRPIQLQIGQVLFTDCEFSLENKLLTRSLKLDRAAIRARFLGPEGSS